VLLAIVLSTALRLWMLTTPAAQLDGDQAVTGIMAHRMVARGMPFVFIAGQRYNGALEQWLQAVMYRFTGLPESPFTLRLVDVALMASAVWLVFVVGRRLLASEPRAALASGIFALGNYWVLWKGNHSDGAYPCLLVVCLIAMTCAGAVASGRRQTGAVLGLGLCLGMIGWLGQSGFELAIPAVLLAGPVIAVNARLIATVCAAAVAGAAPSLVWSMNHGIFAPLDIGLQTQHTTLQQRVGNVFGPLVSEFLGIAGAYGRGGWPVMLQRLVVGCALLGVATMLWHRRTAIRYVLTLRHGGGRQPLDVIVVAVPIVLVCYCLSRSAWDTANPHYLFVFAPVPAWLIASVVPFGLHIGRMAIAATLTAALVATSAVMIAHRYATSPGASDAELHAALRYLAVHDEHAGYAVFWTAMPLQYFAGDTSFFAPIGSGRGKFPAANAAVDASGRFVYIDSDRNDAGQPIARPDIRAALQAHGVSFREHRFGTVTAFDHLVPALRPWQLGLERTLHR